MGLIVHRYFVELLLAWKLNRMRMVKKDTFPCVAGVNGEVSGRQKTLTPRQSIPALALPLPFPHFKSATQASFSVLIKPLCLSVAVTVTLFFSIAVEAGASGLSYNRE